MNKIIIDTQKVEEIYENISIVDTYKQGALTLAKTLCEFRETLNKTIVPALVPIIQEREYIKETLADCYIQYKDAFVNIGKEMVFFSNNVNNFSHAILNYYNNAISEEEREELTQTNETIITEIFQPDAEKKIHTEDSPIIVLSPVNDQVLKYLSENPEEIYKLTDMDFEIVMAEIYARLGYDVTRTQQTRDGGKDIIIRKPEAIGDFIYYVECKKYAPRRHIGVGIVRNLVGTVATDKVNGGILATTSFFTKDAVQFIRDNKWNCQIQMHDYDKIRNLLNRVV